MKLTSGQENALKIAVERYKNNESYTVIAGYAGTGKTTIVQYIINELRIRKCDVAYIAYTGKAALVLQKKGCENAMTAHKLLYKSEENVDGTFTHTPRKRLNQNYKLIVCDEVSMLPEEMIDLLLSHKVYTLFLGDPGQLPPIDGDQNILNSPHAFLDEITRQAEGNPIIKLSMDIRSGGQITCNDSKKCRIMHQENVSNSLLLGADQIIVGRNNTRRAINEKMRMLKWGDKYTNTPINGDKCICLKNKWETVGTLGDPLINGQIGELQNVRIVEAIPYGKIIISDFVTDEGERYNDLRIDYNLIVNGKPTINKDNWKNFIGHPKLFEFDFGYAITCHKSQGSEFDKVVVYDEAFGDKEQKIKWRYTAVTRAAKQLVIVI